MKPSEALTVTLTVNGSAESAEIDAQRTLLDFVRDQLGLTGTKECCIVGECGACTVLIDGKSVNSCLMLAIEADGTAVTTIEGLASDDELHPLQKAFLEKGAAQCGFCIPGQLMSAQALLLRNAHPTEDEVHEALSGNLCRCAGYLQITEAVLSATELESP